MRRHSLAAKIERLPWRAKLLQECRRCRAVGLKPGVLQTRLGDYGARERYGGRYSELPLNGSGLCFSCDPPA